MGASQEYPAKSFEPADIGSEKTGTVVKSLSVKKIFSTRSGRFVIAAVFAIVLVVFALARKNEPAPDMQDSSIDPLLSDLPATLEGSGVTAQPIPSGGFQFQQMPTQTFEPLVIDDSNLVEPTQQNPTLTIVVDNKQPAAPVSPTTNLGGNSGTSTGSPATTPVAKRKPKGYYRASKAAAIMFHDGQGRSSVANLSPAQLKTIQGVEGRAGASKQGQDFTINGITHRMNAIDKGFVPKAAAAAGIS